MFLLIATRLETLKHDNWKRFFCLWAKFRNSQTWRPLLSVEARCWQHSDTPTLLCFSSFERLFGGEGGGDLDLANVECLLGTHVSFVLAVLGFIYFVLVWLFVAVFVLEGIGWLTLPFCASFFFGGGGGGRSGCLLPQRQKHWFALENGVFALSRTTNMPRDHPPTTRQRRPACQHAHNQATDQNKETNQAILKWNGGVGGASPPTSQKKTKERTNMKKCISPDIPLCFFSFRLYPSKSSSFVCIWNIFYVQVRGWNETVSLKISWNHYFVVFGTWSYFRVEIWPGQLVTFKMAKLGPCTILTTVRCVPHLQFRTSTPPTSKNLESLAFCRFS